MVSVPLKNLGPDQCLKDYEIKLEVPTNIMASTMDSLITVNYFVRCDVVNNFSLTLPIIIGTSR